MKAGKLVAAFGVALTLVTIGALGGAAKIGASTTATVCADRPFCITLTDQDDLSRSTESAHYMKYTLVISRNPAGGTSNLTNGRASLTLTDILGDEDVVPDDPDDPNDVPSTASFQEDPSDDRCDFDSAAKALSCTVPNFPAGSTALTYGPLIFTTSSLAGASTKAVALVGFKEKGSDGQPNDPNSDTLLVTNYTTYEGNADLDLSLAFEEATLNLKTSATADLQHTAFPLTIPSGHALFIASVEEKPLAGSFCPTCFGEIVATSTENNSATLFSAARPAHVVITWDFLPSGKTKNNIVVKHLRDGQTSPETITQSCTFGTGGVPTNLPCRDITIDHLGGGAVEVIISAYSDGNGSWGVG